MLLLRRRLYGAARPALVILSVLGHASAATNLSVQKDALTIIADFADRICTKIPLTGTGESLQLSGEGRADLNNAVTRLVNLGIEGAVKYQQDAWKGPLQSDLAKMIRDSDTCRRQVWDDLKDKFLSESNTHTLGDTNYDTKLEHAAFDGWSLTPDWRHLNDMLVNDGSARRYSPSFAPYHPEDPDYTVEAEIRSVHEGSGSGSFGIILRASDQGGYAVGLGAPNHFASGICYLTKGYSWLPHSHASCAAEGPAFRPGTDWHKYRVELKATTIALYIDDALLVSGNDTRFLSAGRIGLWSKGYQLEVREVRVFSNPP